MSLVGKLDAPGYCLFYRNKKFGVDMSRQEENKSCPEDHFCDGGFSALPGRASLEAVVTSNFHSCEPVILVSKCTRPDSSGEPSHVNTKTEQYRNQTLLEVQN